MNVDGGCTAAPLLGKISRGDESWTGDVQHAGEAFSLSTAKRDLRSAKVRLGIHDVMEQTQARPGELRGDKSRPSHGRMWSGERLSMNFTTAWVRLATVSSVKHGVVVWFFFGFCYMWQICVVMGAQVETTQQYSSTFIVLPAQWKLALRWARLILKKTVDQYCWL